MTEASRISNDLYRTRRTDDGPCAGCGRNMREKQVAFKYEGDLYHRKCHPAWKAEVAKPPPREPKPRPILSLSIAGVSLRKAREAFSNAEQDFLLSQMDTLTRAGVDSTHNVSPYHDCKISPVFVCVYKDDDPCNDFCIYCGDPEERKWARLSPPVVGRSPSISGLDAVWAEQ